MFWLICNPNIFLSLSRPSLSPPPPHWHVRRGDWGTGERQGWCLTEPWKLFSCHTFPKRFAAAPIVATEGGLLSWFFRPPAVALALRWVHREGVWSEQWPTLWHHVSRVARVLVQIYDRIPSHGGMGTKRFLTCQKVKCFHSAALFSLYKHQNKEMCIFFPVVLSWNCSTNQQLFW